MNPQAIARATGVLFLITFATSIPALLLFDPILKDGGSSSYLTGGGADDQIFVGVTLELLLIIANVATALVLYPIVRRQSRMLALGYVAARLVECTFIAVGMLSVIAVVTLRQDAPAGADPETLGLVGQALVAVKDASFLLGPGFVVGVGNGLMLGCLMYRSGLIPRQLALVGVVAGPLVCISGILVLFGALEFGGTGQILFTLPEMIWEGLILGVYLLVRGFSRTAPIIADDARPGATPALAPQPV